MKDAIYDSDIEAVLSAAAAAVLGDLRGRYAEWAAWAAPLISEYAMTAGTGAESRKRLDHLIAQAEAKAATLQIATESHASIALRAIVATAVKMLVAL